MEHWSLTAGHVPPPWALVVIVVGLSIAFAEAIASHRRWLQGIPVARARLLLALRVVGLLAVVAMAFEVTIRVDQVTPTGSRVVVLFDRSASVAVPDGVPATPRHLRARDLWRDGAAARARWAEDGLTIETRTFTDTSAPLSAEAEAVLAEPPTGYASDLAQALLELHDAADAKLPLRGVVVVSDGLVAPDAAAERRLEGAAAAVAVPITTIALGAPELRDVSVAEVRAGEFAFVENVTEIEATIVGHGLRGQAVTVELRRDGDLVERTSVTLGVEGVPVRFEVAPDRVGQFVYEVVVDPVEGEATTANNRHAFVVKVLRDKVRVLHVAGRPDWDVRALRTLLRRDPNVELLSYYILRGLDDISREDTSAPLSLIPFPTDELFKEELGSFDLVILHNFDAVQHQVGQYVDNMAQYVLDGGALVLIGGDLAFSDQGYAAGRMASIMPVDTRTQLSAEPGAFRPVLTEAGRRHPITAWLALASDGWGRLPELETHNPLRMASHAPAIGGAALLVHPTARDRTNQPRPLLAIAEPGKGRVLVLGSTETWKMGFAPALPLIDGARPYDLLWLGTIRWMLRDDSSGRLQLETDRPRYALGDPVELQAITLSPAYAPESGVEVAWEVVALEGAEAPPGPVAHGTWTTDEQGRARDVIADLPAGSYAATVRRNAGTEAETHVRRVFIVETPGRELAQIAAPPGTALLQRLATTTGGVFVEGALPPTLPLVDLPEAARERVVGRSERPLWSHALLLLVLVGCLGAEWILRRRSAAA